MLDKTKYIAIAVDVDGEVNLIQVDGTVETLFERGTVEGVSEISTLDNPEPISWLFYFVPSKVQGDPKVRKLHLEYLEVADHGD